MASRSFHYVLCRYDEMACELEKYSSGAIHYQKARQLIRNTLPLKPILKLISVMKLTESNLTEETTGFYEYLRNQIDGYFLCSKDKRHSHHVTENLRHRLYSSIIRKHHWRVHNVRS